MGCGMLQCLLGMGQTANAKMRACNVLQLAACRAARTVLIVLSTPCQPLTLQRSSMRSLHLQIHDVHHRMRINISHERQPHDHEQSTRSSGRALGHCEPRAQHGQQGVDEGIPKLCPPTQPKRTCGASAT